MTTIWELEHSRIAGHQTRDGRCEDCDAVPPMHEEGL